MWGKRPLVLADGVEALVVEHSHQTGISRFSVRTLNGQLPLFLLSWCQTVAEGGPRHLQLFLGHRTDDGSLMLMTDTILHPGEGEQQSVAVFFLVSKLAIDEGCILVNFPTLNHLVAGKEGIDDMEVGIRRTHLNGNR